MINEENMIEVIHYEKANKGSVIGYVDIKINSMHNLIIRRINHIHSNGRSWFNLPSFLREKGDGKPDYLRYCEFESNIHTGQLLDKLSELVKEYCERNSIQSLELINFDVPPMDSNEDLPF